MEVIRSEGKLWEVGGRNWKEWNEMEEVERMRSEGKQCKVSGVNWKE